MKLPSNKIAGIPPIVESDDSFIAESSWKLQQPRVNPENYVESTANIAEKVCCIRL